MLTQPTLEKLRSLKLSGMAEAFYEQLQRPLPDLDFEARLGLLIDREWYLRENRRLTRRLSSAKLKTQACIEDIDFKHARGLNKSVIQELAGGDGYSNTLIYWSQALRAAAKLTLRAPLRIKRV